MIIAVQNQEVYILHFSYDADLNKLIKDVPGWRYIPDQKHWTIPVDRLGFFVARLTGTPYEGQLKVYSDEQLNENATLDATKNVPNVDLTNVPLYIKDGEHFFQHQLDFMKYAIDRQHRGYLNGFILADQPGLGKTLEAMNLALYNRAYYGVKHCLIIACVNSAKYNWIYDIQKHTNGKEVPYLLGSRLKRNGTVRLDGSAAEKLDDLMHGRMYGKEDGDPLPYFLILNIEPLHIKMHRKYAIRERLTTLVNGGYIGMIILDECHKGMSATSIQGKQLLELKRRVGVPLMWLPMTGTPIVNKPTDVYVPLKLVGGHNCKDYYTWCDYFCVFSEFGRNKIIAYKNIPRLKQMLQGNMIRRLKSEIKDFPEKIRIVEYVENSTYQAKLYHQLQEELKAQRDELRASKIPAVRFLRLRQVVGSPELVDPTLKIDKTYLSKNAKLTRLIDLVSTMVDNQEKVIIYSNWVGPLRTIYRFLAKSYKICSYTGTMKAEDREREKQAFINDPSCHILLGTIDALGVSHSLRMANDIIFYDLPWNPATMEQAEDRGNRLDSSGPLNVYILLGKDTVDERVYQINEKKDGMAKYLVDDDLDFQNNPGLVDFLLGCTDLA